MNKEKRLLYKRSEENGTECIDDPRNLRVVFAWSVAHEIVRRLSIAVAVLVFRVCCGSGCERPKIPPQCRGPLTTTPSVCENLRAILIRSRTPERNSSASSHATLLDEIPIAILGCSLLIQGARLMVERSSVFSVLQMLFCYQKSRGVHDALTIRQLRVVVIPCGRGDHALCGGDTHPRLYAKSSHTSKNTCVHARSSRCRITVWANSFVAAREPPLKYHNSV